MSSKDTQNNGNAKKALGEIFSYFNDDKVEAGTNETVVEPVAPVTPVAPKNNTNKASMTNKIHTAASQETFAPTVIAKGLEISGNVKAQGDVNVEGAITGNISSKGKVIITGTVKGNVDAEHLVIEGGTVEAENVKASKDISVGENSVVIGNIQCENIVIDGQITGNLTISKVCDIHSRSVINGNIKVNDLSIQSGAILNGHVSIERNTK